MGDSQNLDLKGRRDMESNRGLSHVLPALRRGGNVLTRSGTTAEKVTKFVVSAAITRRRCGALHSKHWPTSAFDAAMVQLKSVVEVGTRPVSHMPAELAATPPPGL
jgi:hypothetical protein